MGWFDNILKGVPIIGALGDIFGGASAASAQRQANRANIQMNRENREWMERMSNTEWQRGVADMKAAGMNPMLGFSQGGASSPSNSAAQVIPEDAMGRGISSAGTKAMQAVAIAQGVANIGLTEANTKKTIEEAKTASVTSANAGNLQHYQIEEIRHRIANLIQSENLSDAQEKQILDNLPNLIAQAQAQIGLTKQQTSSAAAQEALTRAQLPEAQASAEFWKKLGEGGKGAKWGADILRIIKDVLR